MDIGRHIKGGMTKYTVWLNSCILILASMCWQEVKILMFQLGSVVYPIFALFMQILMSIA